MNEDDLIIYFRLVKSGYASNVIQAAELDSRTVIQALYYDKFIGDYESAYMEICKSENS